MISTSEKIFNMFECDLQSKACNATKYVLDKQLRRKLWSSLHKHISSTVWRNYIVTPVSLDVGGLVDESF